MPLERVNVAGGAEVTVVWTRTLVADKLNRRKRPSKIRRADGAASAPSERGRRPRLTAASPCRGASGPAQELIGDAGVTYWTTLAADIERGRVGHGGLVLGGRDTRAMASRGNPARLSPPTLRLLNCFPQFPQRNRRSPCAVRSGRSQMSAGPHAGHPIPPHPPYEGTARSADWRKG